MSLQLNHYLFISPLTWLKTIITIIRLPTLSTGYSYQMNWCIVHFQNVQPINTLSTIIQLITAIRIFFFPSIKRGKHREVDSMYQAIQEGTNDYSLNPCARRCRRRGARLSGIAIAPWYPTMWQASWSCLKLCSLQLLLLVSLLDTLIQRRVVTHGRMILMDFPNLYPCLSIIIGR